MSWFGMRGVERTKAWQLTAFGVFFAIVFASAAWGQIGLPDPEEELPQPPPRLNPAADPQEAESDREENRQQALSLVQTGQQFARQHIQSGEPRLVLKGVLQFLELERNGIAGDLSPLQALQLFAELAWEQKPKESRRQMLVRLMNAEAEEDPMEVPDDLPFLPGPGDADSENQERQLANQYEENVGQPWPLDWRPRQAEWAAFLETLLEGQASEEGGNFWKGKIAAEPAKADSFRLSYLAIARARRDTELDLDLLAPWLEVGEPALPRQVQRLAELMNTVQILSLAADDPLRRDLRDRFLKSLASIDLGAESFDSPMGRAVRSVVAASDPDSRTVRQEILNRQPPRVFLRLMSGGEDSAEVFSAFYGKRVKLAWREMPLEQGIQELAGLVAVPLWIDTSFRGRTTPVTLNHEGPWLQALDKALEGTDCEARFLTQQVLWIGPKTRRKIAEATYREATARLAHLGGFAGNQDLTEMTAPADTTPRAFSDFVDSWNEAESTQIRIRLLDRTVRSRQITPPSLYLPQALRLALLAEASELDWRVDGAVVLFASKARIAMMEERENRLQRRIVALGDRTDRVASALREQTNIEYEGNFHDALKIIGQGNPLPVLYIVDSRDGPSPDTEASIQPDGETLAHGLDLLTIELNLDWAEDEQALYLGTPNSLATLKRRALLRQNRPAFDSDDAVRMEKPITSLRSDRDLYHLGGQIAAMLKRKLDITAVPEDIKKRSFHLFVHQVPLEQVMDALAAQCGLRWELTPTHVKFSPADRGP